MKTKAIILLLVIISLPGVDFANPAGLTIQRGTAPTVVNGNQLTITASHNAFLNWQSFNIAAGEKTTFIQPSAASVVWNQINDQNASQIYGNLTANGVVVLMNKSGFYFGPDSFVSAAGLVVSTAPVGPVDSSAGLFWQFNGPPPGASIINYGQLNVGHGGSAFLIAEQIENHGAISAPGGSIGLIAGQEVSLSERPDGRGLSATVRLPTGSVDNSGQLIADAGTIALNAQVVNQGGRVQANSIQERNGIIELVALDSLSIGDGAVFSAQRDGTSRSVGGQLNITSGSASLSGNTEFSGFSEIDLKAAAAINVSSGTLTLSSGTPGSLLKLEAGKDIRLDSANLVAAADWAITLLAGRDFTSVDTVKAGAGGILFTGTGSLETQNGNINLSAGKNITIAGGFVRTVKGGSISATAVGGSINTGTKANGFLFYPTGYQVDSDLGGISTAKGGDVSLVAAQDIIGYLPPVGDKQTDGGSGAFGAEHGNVTIKAGRFVTGHYVLRNGTGTITAGRDAGFGGVPRGTKPPAGEPAYPTVQLLALSLVKGGWTVNAAHDILLQEVRNPNGIFNNLGSGSSTVKHFFDYAPGAYAILNAGNSVQLRGTSLPRHNYEAGITPLYPGRLEITAGAGGVVLGSDVILFPSPVGNLKITTTAGGSLVGTTPNDLTQLIASDSGRTQYKEAGDFGVADHADTLLHLNDDKPIELSISGNMEGILLGVPKLAKIKVDGNMINSRFEGQNLHGGDATSIKVTGDIINRNEYTTVSVKTSPDFGVFDLLYEPLADTLALRSQFSYDAANHTLTFKGRMTGAQLAALQSLQVRVFDANGLPILVNGEPATQLAQFVSADALTKLYVDSQDVMGSSDTGYRLGGGGSFNVSAHNMDLGATMGLVSQGPRANAALARYFTRGADINVSLSGNLDMFYTKIASLNGGKITITADGHVKVGSRNFTSNDQSARGIYTVDQSDIAVIARGDVDLNGSRIAAYDGGNILVRSLVGNVDAGTGISGAAAVEKIYVDPLTRRILTYEVTIPGSGILATTFPPSLDPAFPRSVSTVGNILVETPRGDILASAGGIVQIPLNGIGANLGTVTLRAGTRDAAGHVIYVGNIDASGSGVIGSSVKLEASGDIKGLVFARADLNISANRNVNVTALAGGNANVSAGANVTGTIIGVGSVNASGANVDASLLSQNVTTSGDASTSQVGFSQGAAASGTSQGMQNDEPAKMVAASSKNDDTGELNKKRTGPRLAKTSGRVTVILPTKIN